MIPVVDVCCCHSGRPPDAPYKACHCEAYWRRLGTGVNLSAGDDAKTSKPAQGQYGHCTMLGLLGDLDGDQVPTRVLEGVSSKSRRFLPLAKARGRKRRRSFAWLPTCGRRG